MSFPTPLVQLPGQSVPLLCPLYLGSFTQSRSSSLYFLPLYLSLHHTPHLFIQSVSSLTHAPHPPTVSHPSTFPPASLLTSLPHLHSSGPILIYPPSPPMPLPLPRFSPLFLISPSLVRSSPLSLSLCSASHLSTPSPLLWSDHHPSFSHPSTASHRSSKSSLGGTVS